MISNSFFSLLDRVLSAGLKFVSIILLGRWLGASGQGVFSVYLVIWAWSGTFASIGLGLSNNYFGAKDTSSDSVAALLGNTVIFGVVSGVITSIAVYLLSVYTPIFRALPENHLSVLPLGVLLYALYVPLQGLLLGIGEFRTRAVSTFINFSLFIGLITFRQINGNLSEDTLGFDWLLTIGVSLLIWLWQFLRHSNFRITWQQEMFKEQIAYGKESYKYQLASAALVRIDLLAVSYFLGANAAGVYSVALYFAEILMYFPSALTTVLLTAIGGKEHITKGFYRSISTVFLLAIAVTAVVIPIAIKVFFSDQYLGAIILAEIMLLGVYWLGMGHIASFHMFGDRNLTQPFRASLIAAVIEICLVLFLIPIAQLPGVAIASTVAYMTFGLLTLNQTAKKLSTHLYMLLRPYFPNTFVQRMLTYYETQK